MQVAFSLANSGPIPPPNTPRCGMPMHPSPAAKARVRCKSRIKFDRVRACTTEHLFGKTVFRKKATTCLSLRASDTSDMSLKYRLSRSSVCSGSSFSTIPERCFEGHRKGTRCK